MSLTIRRAKCSPRRTRIVGDIVCVAPFHVIAIAIPQTLPVNGENQLVLAHRIDGKRPDVNVGRLDDLP